MYVETLNHLNNGLINYHSKPLQNRKIDNAFARPFSNSLKQLKGKPSVSKKVISAGMLALTTLLIGASIYALIQTGGLSTPLSILGITMSLKVLNFSSIGASTIITANVMFVSSLWYTSRSKGSYRAGTELHQTMLKN